VRGQEGNSDVKQEPQALLATQAQGGLGIDDPFESQLHIVLDFTDALINDFASRLLDGAYDHETAQSVFIPDCPCSHRC